MFYHALQARSMMTPNLQSLRGGHHVQLAHDLPASRVSTPAWPSRLIFTKPLARASTSALRGARAWQHRHRFHIQGRDLMRLSCPHGHNVRQIKNVIMKTKRFATLMRVFVCNVFARFVLDNLCCACLCARWLLDLFWTACFAHACVQGW